MASDPAITSREAWRANPLHTPAGTIATPTPDLWLHHTGSSGLHGVSGMQSLQSGALAGGYVDLEYTYVVDTDGTIFMSRGPGHNTAATGGSTNGQANNARSHAICAMGNFENDQPTPELINSIGSLVAYMHRNRWTASPRITGPHKSAPGNATACCGRNLIARIDDINKIAAGGTSTPAPEPKDGGAMEIVTTPSGNGYYVVDSTGAVFAYGDARYHGGANTIKINAPIVGMDVRPQNDGYWLIGADGGVFAYGAAKFHGAPTGLVH